MSEPKAPEIPDPVIPAPAAPSRKQDTGALVLTGSSAGEDIKNKRASGGGSGSTSRSTLSLGTLGRGSGLGL